MITPLHHRVLIRPDAQPTETESGLALALDSQPPDTSGVVVSRGNGPRWASEIRRNAIRDCIRIVRNVYFGDHASFSLALAELELAYQRSEVLRDGDVPIGARVVFSPTSGQIVELPDGPHLLLAEDDLLGVVEDA